MKTESWQQCIIPSCGKKYSVKEQRTACDCGELLDVRYSGDFPESCNVKHMQKEMSLFISNKRVEKETFDSIKSNVRVTTKRIVEIEGEGLLLKEYALKLMDSYPEDEIKVSEKMFLLPEIANSPVALALDPLIIGKRRETRLFVLEAFHDDI